MKKTNYAAKGIIIMNYKNLFKNSKKIFFYSLLIGISINIIFFICYEVNKYNSKRVYKKYQDFQKVFVYDNYYQAINPAVILYDINDSSKLINYYNKLARHIDIPYGFEINYIPINSNPFIIGYECDSQILNVIDFDTSCWCYQEGYIFKGTSHLVPANVKFENNNQSNIYKKPNFYGFFCK